MRPFFSTAAVVMLAGVCGASTVDLSARESLLSLPNNFFYASGHGADWDGDGDQDLIVGAMDNSASFDQENCGKMFFVENSAGPGNTPVYEAPELITYSTGQTAVVSGSG